MTATDSHPRYAACIDWFMSYWSLAARQLPCDVDVTVFVIGNDPPASNVTQYGRLVHLDPGLLPTGFAAQTIRVLAGAWSECDVVMTTDIDMMPLDQRVTRRMLEAWQHAPESFVVGRHVLPPGQYAICYNLASPGVWARLWSTVPGIDSVVSEMSQVLDDFGGRYDSQHGGIGWHIDQEFLFSRLHEIATPLTLLTDEQTGHRRLDRGEHPFPVNWSLLPRAALGGFTDYHVHHPVARNRRFLSTLLKVAGHRTSRRTAQPS